MTYIQRREVYIPQDHKKVDYTDINGTVYTFLRNGQLCAVYFGGKRTKKDWGYTFGDETRRQLYINKRVHEQRELKAKKDQIKDENNKRDQELFKGIKPGDIFYTSGGYDQTNVSFYQLISLKGKRGTFQHITKSEVKGSEGYMSAHVVPDVDNFTGEEFTKQIKGDSFKADYYRAYKTDPLTSHYCSWYA